MPKRIGLRYDEWPAQDRDAWERARESSGLLDQGGVASKWRPATLARAEAEYGRWLAFVWSFKAESFTVTAAERVTLATIRAYVDVLRGRIAPMSVSAALGHLMLALRAMETTTDWSWLRRIQRKAANTAKRREKRHRM